MQPAWEELAKKHERDDKVTISIVRGIVNVTFCIVGEIDNVTISVVGEIDNVTFSVVGEIDNVEHIHQFTHLWNIGKFRLKRLETDHFMSQGGEVDDPTSWCCGHQLIHHQVRQQERT